METTLNQVEVTIDNIVPEIQKTFDAFIKEAEQSVKGNKSAGVRARKISLGIEAILKTYRKLSLEAAKK